MLGLTVYLTYNGNTLEAFEFYKSILGGEFLDINYFKEMPASEGYEVPEADLEKILHITYKINETSYLMASDSSTFSGDATFGNNFSLSISPESKEEADKIYNELSAGGNIIMPIQDTFWGAYYGMFTDKFGINWAINFAYPQA